MSLISETTIILAGKEVPTCNELRLHQKIHSHHILEARFPRLIFEKDDGERGNKCKEFLGETISIQISKKDTDESSEKLVFKGIITGVNITGVNTHKGEDIVLIATSQDVISNDGPNYNCYHEKDIGAIVKKALSDYGFKLKVNCSYGGKINYVVQHNESAYQFVQRLSEQYGQWFYYNGEELIFGDPEIKETELLYPNDLLDFKVNLIPQPQKFNYFSNDYLQDKVQEDRSTHKPSVSGHNATVYDKSNLIFKNETNVWVNSNNENDTNKILKHKAKVQQESFAIHQVKITGNSENTGVAIGAVVKIEGEKYRVIEVYHFLDHSGHYSNQFEGVSANQDGYPHTNINAFPISQSQTAKVVDTNDPEGLGRIKVAFAWQDLIGETSPWIRVLTPSAGNGQGIQFLPEIGNQVLVDFEGGDAECPYVIGSMYHKNSKPGGDWGSQGNDVKIIHTRGGHKITFNDKDGDESLTIEDKKGNKVLIDTKNSNISLTAGNNISITAGKDISITAGGKLDVSAGQDASITATMKLAGTAGTDLTLSGGTKAELTAPMIGIKADASAKLEAPMVDIDGKGMTNVKGGIVNLN